VLLAALASCVPAFSAPVQGTLEKIGDVQVLRVHGTPQEMGRAHGYLLADEIIADVQDSAKFFFGDANGYEGALQLTAAAIEFPESSKLELAGILVGITERKGEAPRVEFFGRPLKLEDLMLGNALDTLRAFGCSGFTVWGDKAGNAGIITGRNFDFDVMGEKLGPSLIIVRAPEGRRQAASVASAGYIGVYTGLNEDGVCAFLHDGTGPHVNKPLKKYVPLAIGLKDFLEEVTPADAMTGAEASLHKIAPYPFSYLVRIIAPRVKGRDDAPARVFRVDGDGLSQNPLGDNGCSITTNHYLDQDLKPVPSAGTNSTFRYDRLAERVNSLVDSKVAWEALKSVAVRSSRSEATQHSLVVYPELRVVEIAFASPGKDGFIPAPDNKPLVLPFDKLFSRP
jgi:hypothetical protein